MSLLSLFICHEVRGPDDLSFVNAEFWMVSAEYLGLFIFLQTLLILVWTSSNLAFHMMHSAYKLNMQGGNIQPCTPFPILNQSVVPCLVLNVASWPTYKSLHHNKAVIHEGASVYTMVHKRIHTAAIFRLEQVFSCESRKGRLLYILRSLLSSSDS